METNAGRKRKCPGSAEQGRAKRRRHYWIEQCNETPTSNESNEEPAFDVTVLVSLIQLDHINGNSVDCQQKTFKPPSDGSVNQVTDETQLSTPDDRLSSSSVFHLEGPCISSFATTEGKNSQDKTQEEPPRVSCCGISEDSASRDLTVSKPRVRVLHHHSAQGDLKYFDHIPCGDGTPNPYPESEVPDKYWAQRKYLFSKFGQGVQLDREGWFSVTPEAIANHNAQRMVELVVNGRNNTGSDCIILDAFAGVGGNSIAFALHPKVSKVICVDIDKDRLKMAASNCRIYGVSSKKIVFIHADACSVMRRFMSGWLVTPSKRTTEVDCSTVAGYSFGGEELLPGFLHGIYLSPPWGGIDYNDVGPSNYDLSLISVNESAENGKDLLFLAVDALPSNGGTIAYLLPRNINGTSIGEASFSVGLRMIELEQNFHRMKLKTVTMYARKG